MLALSGQLCSHCGSARARNTRWSPQAVALLVLLSMAAHGSAATLQQESAEDRAAARPKAGEGVLVVWVDSACQLLVDGDELGDLEAKRARKIGMSVGEHLVEVVCAEGVGRDAIVEIDENRQKVMRFELARDVEKAEEERLEVRQEAERRLASVAEGVLQDQTSGLLWTQSDNGYDLAQADARLHCQALTAHPCSAWRLPEISELERLHFAQAKGERKIYPHFSLASDWIWSETRGRDGYAWYFHFGYGTARQAQVTSPDLRALCVCSDPSMTFQ